MKQEQATLQYAVKDYNRMNLALNIGPKPDSEKPMNPDEILADEDDDDEEDELDKDDEDEDVEDEELDEEDDGNDEQEAAYKTAENEASSLYDTLETSDADEDDQISIGDALVVAIDFVGFVAFIVYMLAKVCYWVIPGVGMGTWLCVFGLIMATIGIVTFIQWRADELGQGLKREKAEHSTADRARKQAKDVRSEVSSEVDAGEARLKTVIAVGESQMARLEKIRRELPPGAMADKIGRLHKILGMLFATLKKYPEQLGMMDRCMDYYLPTTMKLAKTYQEFLSVELPGDNIENAMKEIEKSMDTVSDGLEKLLDDLYGQTAFDTITDASVLQTMMHKDGLAKSDFSLKQLHAV